jgi:signal transduction histidine kinase
MKPLQALSVDGPVDFNACDETDRQRGSSAISTAGAIHDLGNLIQIASSAINIVARMPDMSATHSAPMLDRAKTSLEQAGALVRQTMGFMRDRTIASVSSNVSMCLADVANLIGSISESGLAVDVHVEPGLPDVRCDPIGLRRAVLNLVFNARDAMAGHGLISIQARTSLRGGVEIRVADTGVGMSPATIARVFDPFFTTKSDGLGGIGLPMVERFVRDAGGEIAIVSEPGAGTTVTLRLPQSNLKE